MSERPGIPWQNHGMKKFGTSLKRKIAEAHDGFVRAVVIVDFEKKVQELEAKGIQMGRA